MEGRIRRQNWNTVCCRKRPVSSILEIDPASQWSSQYIYSSPDGTVIKIDMGGCCVDENMPTNNDLAALHLRVRLIDILKIKCYFSVFFWELWTALNITKQFAL